MPYRWDFSFLAAQYPVLVSGVAGTFRLAAVALACGAGLGLLVGISRTAELRPARWLAACFIELFRNIPPLILLFWFFYVIPVMSGRQTPPFAAASVALSLYMGAYSAEIVRAGIQSIERGQWDAARSIGFGYGATMRYVILPQALRRIVPALTNQSIELVKATALASTIAYAEILYSAKLISEQEFRPLESYTVAAAVFIALLVFLAFLSTRLERRLRQSD